jgi:hypothetical protein
LRLDPKLVGFLFGRSEINIRASNDPYVRKILRRSQIGATDESGPDNPNMQHEFRA